jgi:hypothetical protein
MTDRHDPETGEVPAAGHNSGHADPEEQRVDDALALLFRNIKRGAEAAGERMYLSEFRKSLKAIIMAESGAGSAAIQEREAYRHPRYMAHLQKMRDAEVAYETTRGERAWAERVIDVYRTRQANTRPARKL